MGTERANQYISRVRQLARGVEGITVDSVAKELGVNRSTVYRWIERYRDSSPGERRENFFEYPAKKPSGRPGKITQEQVGWVLNEVKGSVPSDY
jgi:transposase